MSNAIQEPINPFTSIRAITVTIPVIPTISTTSTTSTTPWLVEVVISANKCFGISEFYGTHARLGEDEFNAVGFNAFCDALRSSNVQRLDFADTGLNPTSVKTLADAIPTISGLVGVDISRNQISADVAPVLIESIQKSNIKTLVIGKSASLAVGGLGCNIP